MTTTPTLREAAQQFVQDYENGDLGDLKHYARSMRAALAEQAAKQAEPVACRTDGMPASANERHLRRLLAYRTGILGAYYDDGEAQGQEHGISIDFMREPVADIDAKLRALNVARASFAAPPAPARQEPLTDEQITEACRGIFLSDYRSAREYDFAIARAIERAHGITAAPAEGGAA